jgi:2-polyprenyl-3-methyl-5-hydroxy-6-metoxy-1,4-benzoquinol methylase
LRGIKVIQRKVNKPGAVLFDIGCGGGYFVDLAQKAGYTAKGVDIDPSAVESGRKRGLELYCCELHQLSLDAESVDVITLWDCIEHVRNPIELMREITRILKSDGFVLIQSPNNLLWSILVKSKIKQVDPFEMVAWTHIYHWTPKSLRNILLQSGIRKVTFYPMNSFPAELPILSFASLAHNLKRLIFYLSLRKINIYFPLFALGFK